jgi:hypothetical protein
MVFYHKCFWYPPIDNSHVATPMIDASYCFFMKENQQKAMRVVHKIAPPLNQPVHINI